VCEYIEQLKAENADPESLKPLYPKKRFLMFVIDVRDDTTIAKGLRWYDAPPKLVGEIIGRSKDKRTRQVIDVCDPKEGRDIEFVRKGQGLKTDYTGIDLKVTEEVPPDWYENVPTFDEVLAIPTYEQVYQQLTGGVPAAASEEQPAGNTQATDETGDEVGVEVEQEATPVNETPAPAAAAPAPAPAAAAPAPEAPKPQPQQTAPATPSPRGGPSPRGTTSRPATPAAQTPAAASGSVRDKIAEIRNRRATGQS